MKAEKSWRESMRAGESIWEFIKVDEIRRKMRRVHESWLQLMKAEGSWREYMRAVRVDENWLKGWWKLTRNNESQWEVMKVD